MSRKPNILLITADQLRRDALGVFGNRVIRTPHLDDLANNGVVFDQHFTQHPVCTPSRWTIFTGRYPHSHGVWDNGVIYQDGEVTMARVLRENGYRTGAFGKMHLSPQLLNRASEDENWPEDGFGFAEKHLTDDRKRGEYLEDLKRRDPSVHQYVLRQGEEKVREDLMSAAERSFQLAPQLKENKVPAELHQSSWIADRVIDALRAGDGKPFFFWCSFVDPHHPFDAPEPYASMYDLASIPLPVRRENEMLDKPPHFDEMVRGLSPGNEKYELFRVTDRGWQALRANYYGMVSLIDHNVGRILEALRSAGLFEDTIVAFTSDHGELLGDHGLLFKGPFHYDPLIRVPLVLRWGEAIRGGSRVSGITQHTDLLPTLLGCCGVSVPRGAQGRSLLPLIEGDEGAGYEHALVEHNCGDWGLSLKTLRSRQWRLTWYGGRRAGELYDLCADPNELLNRWPDPAYREARGELEDRLLDRLLATEDTAQERQSKY
jgi:arylsulfatase A-like enzyme